MGDRLLLNGRVLDAVRAELRDESGKVLPLRPQALSVLLELATRQGQVVEKRELMSRVWPGVVVTDDSLVQCVVDIRRELGDTEQRIVRTVPRRGYVLIADDADAVGAGSPSTLHPPVARRHRRHGVVAAAIAGLAAIALLAWRYDFGASDAARRRGGDPGDEAVLAVLPLRELNVEDPNTAPGGMGLAYMIAGELARHPELRVVSTLVSVELRAKALSARQIGSITGARYVVDGSVERLGNRLGLEIHLIDTTNDRIVWSDRLEPTAQELPDATERLVQRIGGSVGSTVIELRRSASLSRAPASLDAHALSLHAIAIVYGLASAEKMRTARQELERATRLDPGYAPAWATLGLAKTLLISSRNDATLGPQDRPAALADIRKAIELDPSLAASWRALSIAIDSSEHADEAVQAAERAVALGPGDPENWLTLGLAQYHARQMEAALRNVEKASAWNRGLRPPSYAVVEARLRYAMRDYPEARRSARECMERVPLLVVCKAIWLSTQMRTGHAAEAEAAWPGLVAAAPWLASYRYAPRGTPEARAIDEDLDHLRAPTAALR